MKVKITTTLIDAIAEAIYNDCGEHRSGLPYCETSEEMKSPYRQMVNGMVRTFLGLGYQVHHSEHTERYLLQKAEERSQKGKRK